MVVEMKPLDDETHRAVDSIKRGLTPRRIESSSYLIDDEGSEEELIEEFGAIDVLWAVERWGLYGFNLRRFKEDF